jgi:hypothetical protein
VRRFIGQTRWTFAGPSGRGETASRPQVPSHACAVQDQLDFCAETQHAVQSVFTRSRERHSVVPQSGRPNNDQVAPAYGLMACAVVTFVQRFCAAEQALSHSNGVDTSGALWCCLRRSQLRDVPQKLPDVIAQTLT